LLPQAEHSGSLAVFFPAFSQSHGDNSSTATQQRPQTGSPLVVPPATGSRSRRRGNKKLAERAADLNKEKEKDPI
jgi:hypothetical protein